MTIVSARLHHQLIYVSDRGRGLRAVSNRSLAIGQFYGERQKSHAKQRVTTRLSGRLTGSSALSIKWT